MACAGTGAPRPTRPWARAFSGGGRGEGLFLSPLGASWCRRVGLVPHRAGGEDPACARLARRVSTSTVSPRRLPPLRSNFTHLLK